MGPTVLFCSDVFWDQRAEQIVAVDPTVEVVRLVGDERITSGDLDLITVAFFSPDLWPDRSKESWAPACARQTSRGSSRSAPAPTTRCSRGCDRAM